MGVFCSANQLQGWDMRAIVVRLFWCKLSNLRFYFKCKVGGKKYRIDCFEYFEVCHGVVIVFSGGL